MGADMNLTYQGIKMEDGYECMIWSTEGGSTFAVRLTDLAIVEMDLHYVLSQVIPMFPIFGLGAGRTLIQFTKIEVGAPDPSNFAPPSGVCIKVYPTPPSSPKKIHFKDLSTVLADTLKENPIVSAITKINPMEYLIEKLQKVTNIQKKQAFQNSEDKWRINQGPVPPRLNQTFSVSWTLNASEDLTPPYTPYTLSGQLAFDFTTSGLSWSIESTTGNIPMDVQFELRLFPSMNGVELLQVGPQGECYSYIFLQWLWTYLAPQFEIPYDSGEQGPAVVNGEACTVWQTTWNWYDNFAELYVRDSDHVLVQLTIPEPFGHGLATITFTNIKTHVNPSSYSRPSTCVETMTWNPSWESHLPWAWCYPYC